MKKVVTMSLNLDLPTFTLNNVLIDIREVTLPVLLQRRILAYFLSIKDLLRSFSAFVSTKGVSLPLHKGEKTDDMNFYSIVADFP